MKRFNYHPRLSTGSVAAGGTLGFLIPPSIGFIVYGMMTEQSIGKLLVAGMIPGLTLAAAYIAIIVVRVKLNPSLAPASPEPVTWREKFKALTGIWEPLAIFLVVIVALIKRKLTGQNLVQALQEAIRISVMVLFLVAGANVFSYFLALSMIPMKVAEWVAGLQVTPYLIHAIIVVIYLFLGCFLDAISMMVLTLPVIFPIILALGFDPIWFGVIAVLMMEAGLITPPMGLNIFTVAGVVKDVSVEEIFRGTLPFLLSIFVIVILITIFPKIALLLPNMMMR
jgi:TRAP-type C4-dicarboxylate transport system permease large subunit